MPAFAQMTGKEITITVGGGTRSPEMTGLLVKEAGGSKSKILVVTWAAEKDPQGSATSIAKDLHRHGPQSVDFSLRPPQTEAEARIFLEQLKNSDAIFFSGGAQRRIVKVFNDFPELKKEVLARYHEGMPILGTSAGTAMQSKTMIADRARPPSIVPPIEPGLGTLPDDVILDTHYFVRQRWERLVPLSEAYPGILGVGIDENGAAVIRGGRHLEVIGYQNVMIVDGKNIYELRPGDLLDLKTREVTRINPSGFRQCLLYPLQLLLGK